MTPTDLDEDVRADPAYAEKLEAAMPTMMRAAEMLVEQGYTLPEIGDAFLTAGTTFGVGLAGEQATGRILIALGTRMATRKPPSLRVVS